MSGQILPPGGDLDAGEHDLVIALLRQLPGLLRRPLQGQGTYPAPGVGDDAVGAEVDAAVLDLQHGPGAALQAAGGQLLKVQAAEGVVQGGDGLPLPCGALHQLHKARPVAGAADQVHPQLLHVAGMGLGIAAAHGDHRVRRGLPGPADDLPGLFVADGGDGAGVDEIGVRRPLEGDQFVAPGGEQLLQGLGLILVHLAAQSIEGDPHFLKLGTTAKKVSSPSLSLITQWCFPSGQ